MNGITKAGIIGGIVGMVIAVVAMVAYFGDRTPKKDGAKGQTTSETSTDSSITPGGDGTSTNTTDKIKKEKGLGEKPQIVRSLERKPLEPEATKRLADGPQTITTVFEATGKGTWKKLAGKVSGKYFLTSYVKAISTVDKVKTETARGNFEVTEIRKFVEVRDRLTMSEIDLGLALRDTLPVDTVIQAVNGIGMVLGFAEPGSGGLVVVFGEAVDQAVRSIDGTSLRGLCGKFGVEIPTDIEKWANAMAKEFVDGKLEGVRKAIHSIEGKSYKIVYLQDKEGVTLRVDFTNVDGSPIEEDEWEILKFANVFIDAQVIPDKRAQPGDKWEVDAETIAGLVDPVAQGGKCEGKISVERKDDLPNGDWKMQFLPAKITTKSGGGATEGVFKISDGAAVGDGKNAYVKSMQLVGTGRLSNRKSSRWAIFDVMTSISGDCDFRAIMTSDRTSKK